MPGDEYMQTVEIYECRNCGVIWFAGEKPVKLQPEEEFSLLYMRKGKCKWCPNKSRGSESRYGSY
jgi:hypothetical protein